MSFKFTAPTKQLADASRIASQIAAIPSKAAKPSARAIDVLIQKQFTLGRDPFGKPWARLRPATRAKGRRPPPLTDTGKFRGEVRVKPTQSAGIIITMPAIPGRFHQDGTRNMKRRQVLPETTLPKTWVGALTEVYEQLFSKAIK